MEKKRARRILEVKELVRNYYTVNSEGEKIACQVLKGVQK